MKTRATKIVATIGPASNTPEILKRMIEAGVDVVRLNFSHGTAEDHVARAQMVRDAAAACGREIAIMADLQGPKIRVGKFKDGKIELVKGEKFILMRSARWVINIAPVLITKNCRTTSSQMMCCCSMMD